MHRPGAGRTAGSRAPSLEETFYPFVLRRQDSYTAVGPEGDQPPSPGDRSPALRPQLAQDTWERERELQLAAELGKALLERNEELGRERERETQEWAQRLEVGHPRGEGDGTCVGMGLD
ncbi:hypothetical protein chiPu_0027499 [Chiloscyllium punctatum]|uniref:BICD family-like cargo adapter 2 n=1 Tax=Chiloscyllium punctatum TaxID=137246 RepID=A0A401TLA9_CHIPU|nr:hypothetical protein [Chiloscyllium punctatum]